MLRASALVALVVFWAAGARSSGEQFQVILDVRWDTCGSPCRTVWPYWQVASTVGGQVHETHAAFAITPDSSSFGPLAVALDPAPGLGVGLGLVAHWDVVAHGFDPVCLAAALPPQAGRLRVQFALLTPRQAEVFVDGIRQLVNRTPVRQGVIVLNQQAEGRESTIAATFRTSDVQRRLAEWEDACRLSFGTRTGDADWYCGRRHQYRTHVLAGVLLASSDLRSLPGPAGVAHIARPVTDRGDRTQALNYSSKGYGGPYLLADMTLVDGLQAWYVASRSLNAFPGDGITSGGYFGVRSLVRSDIWILEVPDALRVPLVEACRAVVAEWAGLELQDLELYYAGHHARIYRRGSSCPVHVDRRPAGVETLSCVYHLGSMGASGPGYPEWPMVLESHSGRAHPLVFRSPGELVVYEASIVPHGRPSELVAAAEYVNVFVHLVPKVTAGQLLARAGAVPPARVVPGRSGPYAQSCLEGGPPRGCQTSDSSAALAPRRLGLRPGGLARASAWEDEDGQLVDWIEPLPHPADLPRPSGVHMQSLRNLTLGQKEAPYQRATLLSASPFAPPGALHLLVRSYKDVGVHFERILTREERLICGQPTAQHPQDGEVSSAGSASGRGCAVRDFLASLGTVCLPEDFCVLHIKGDRRGEAFLNRLTASPEKVALVDELFWNSPALGGPRVRDYYTRLRTLRELGIRAHAWT